MCFVFNMKSVLLARLTEVLNFHLSSLKVILHLLVCYELYNVQIERTDIYIDNHNKYKHIWPSSRCLCILRFHVTFMHYLDQI